MAQNDLILLDLNGNFDLRGQAGDPIPVVGDFPRALLVMVARSRDMKRSRAWLQTQFWPSRGDAQRLDSLRSLLRNLRKQLGVHADILQSDRSHVWLSGVENVSWRGESGVQFFEDAQNLTDSLFWEWLDLERTGLESCLAEGRGSQQVGGKARNPCVVIASPQIIADDVGTETAAMLLRNSLIHSFRTHRMVDIFDLDDLETNQLSQFGEAQVPEPEATVHIRFVKLGSQVQITILVRDARTHKVIWTSSTATETAKRPPFSLDQLTELSNQTVDAVHEAVLSRDLRHGMRYADVGRKLFLNAHGLISMSRGTHDYACASLLKIIEETQSSIAMAWYAYSFANAFGECRNTVGPDFFQQAEFHCAMALEREPDNGLVVALVAHVYGFVLRRFELAAELAETARRLSPGIALVWDLSAMNALYSGRTEEGYAYSKVARRLGRFSPFKPLFDSSLAISATVTGRHEEAISVGTALLDRRPGFLAVERHQFASLSALGQIDEARARIAAIRERDPNFLPARINDRDYPLPCLESVQLIGAAFEETGFTKLE